jgi:hypothetical protein
MLALLIHIFTLQILLWLRRTLMAIQVEAVTTLIQSRSMGVVSRHIRDRSHQAKFSTTMKTKKATRKKMLGVMRMRKRSIAT